MPFIRDLVQALAWPTVLLVGLVLLRREIRQLIPKLRRISIGPAEAQFDADLTHARQLAEEQVISDQPAPAGEASHPVDRASGEADESPPTDVAPPVDRQVAGIAEVAALAPRSVILEAWLKLESTAAALLEAHGIRARGGRVTPADLERLVKAGELDSTDLEIFEDLRQLRNRAAHREYLDIDGARAIEYSYVAAHLSRRLAAAMPGDS